MPKKLFTPAPWFAVEYGPYFNLQDDPHYGEVNLLDAQVNPFAMNDAQLAAAAPELAKALRGLLLWAGDLPPAAKEDLQKAIAAYKKATE